MMAHELPLSIHSKPSYDAAPKQPQHQPPPTSKKNKANKGVERTLPSGEPVDFGGKKSNSKPKLMAAPSLPDGSAPKFHPDAPAPSGATGKSKKSKNKKHKDASIPEPSLPNGAKPNFYNNDQGKPSRPIKKNEQTLPNGSKPNFNPSSTSSSNKKNSNNKNKKADTVPAVEETYAGSSFHSSPAALNLPKPSFKTSPKSSNLSTKSSSPQPAQQERSPIQSMQQQGPQGPHAPQAPQAPHAPHVIQHLPQQGPHLGAHHFPYPNGPMFPVAPYPHTSLPPAFPSPNQNPMIYRGNQFVQPGFSYQHSPQGYITYQGNPQQINPQGAPQGAFNGAPFPFTPQQQSAPYPQANSSQQGQKISFVELLDSGSK
ncbi:enhancer of mRNA-decapping protein 1 [[Candida] railenensis]|uniref:Enhancer of mRNA-decapping protein 1 n=1 Tax=[Candida] railenensis TaxID=45579 RepID=A0A9P0QNR9_9ASCO|nr:enhancer of mRNA-decapping protein 1 [[Candida] railenensis]